MDSTRFLALLLLVVTCLFAPPAGAPICNELWPNCWNPCVQGTPAYEDWYCHRCLGQCFAAAPGTADDVVRALEGVQDVRAVGDTVIISDADAAKKPAGLKFDIEMARKFAAVNPAVATALLSFHPDYRTPGLPINLLRGAVASPGIPTLVSFELVAAQVRDKAQFARSLTPVEPGRYLQVRWDAIEIDDDTLEVTFFTEIIDDDSRIKRRTHPNTVMLVSKSTRTVLSLTQQ